MKKSIALIVLLFGVPGFGQSVGSLKMKIFAAWLYAAGDCSGTPVQVFSNSGGTEVDIIAGGNYGSGNVPAGTYRCIVLKMSDNVKFTPSSSTGSCVSGQAGTTMDVCNTGTTWTCPDGTSGSCTTGVNDAPCLYLANNSTCASPGAGGCGNTFLSPSAGASNGLTLTGQVIAPGGGKFGATVGSVSGTGGSCQMSGTPSFYFKNGG